MLHTQSFPISQYVFASWWLEHFVEIRYEYEDGGREAGVVNTKNTTVHPKGLAADPSLSTYSPVSLWMYPYDTGPVSCHRSVPKQDVVHPLCKEGESV